MNYPTYKRAKLTLKPLGFESKTDYFEEAEDLGLPMNPEEVYQDEWEGWEVYLTTLRSLGKRTQSSSDKVMNDWLSRPWTANH